MHLWLSGGAGGGASARGPRAIDGARTPAFSALALAALVALALASARALRLASLAALVASSSRPVLMPAASAAANAGFIFAISLACAFASSSAASPTPPSAAAAAAGGAAGAAADAGAAAAGAVAAVLSFLAMAVGRTAREAWDGRRGTRSRGTTTADGKAALALLWGCLRCRLRLGQAAVNCGHWVRPGSGRGPAGVLRMLRRVCHRTNATNQFRASHRNRP